MGLAELSEEGTQVILFTEPPTMLLKARFSHGVFYIENHWAIKEVRPMGVVMWDYLGQVDMG